MRMIAHLVVRENNGNFDVCVAVPLWDESIGDRWISPPGGQVMLKYFNAILSYKNKKVAHETFQSTATTQIYTRDLVYPPDVGFIL